LWLCQDEEGDANVEMALKNPALFVLKPQREGGGKLWSRCASCVVSQYKLLSG